MLVESGQEFTISGLRLAEGASNSSQTLRMSFRWVAEGGTSGLCTSILRQTLLPQYRLTPQCAGAAAAQNLEILIGLSTGLTHTRAPACQAGGDAEPGRELAARGRALGLARRRRHPQPLLRAGAHRGRRGCQVP